MGQSRSSVSRSTQLDECVTGLHEDEVPSTPVSPPPHIPLKIEHNRYLGAVFVCGVADSLGITEQDRNKKSYSFYPVDYSYKYFNNAPIHKIVCGLNSSFFITNNGVYACGGNKEGELGLGYSSETTIKTPTRVPLSATIHDIVTGTRQYTIFVMSNGELLHCGYRLDFTYERNIQPKALPPVPLANYKKIIGGDSFVLVLTLGGQVYGLGHVDGYKLALDHFVKIEHSLLKEPIIDIGCGQRHIILITESGSAIGFGMQSYGQLGVPEHEMNGRDSTSPIRINVCGKIVTRVFCKSFHTFFQAIDGDIYASGFYADGRLGINNNDASGSYYYEFIRLPLRIKSRIVSVAGFISTIFLTEWNEIFVCGGNSGGHLGTGNLSAVRVAEQVFPDFPMGYESLRLNCAYGQSHALLYFTSPSGEREQFTSRLHTALKSNYFSDINL